jgi:hypothetical protein
MAMEAAAAIACAICVKQSRDLTDYVRQPRSAMQRGRRLESLWPMRTFLAFAGTVNVATMLCGAESKVPGEKTSA